MKGAGRKYGMYIELAPTKSIRGMGRKDRRYCGGEREAVGDEGRRRVPGDPAPPKVTAERGMRE